MLMMNYFLSTERTRDVIKNNSDLSNDELGRSKNRGQALKYLAKIYGRPSDKPLTESDYKNIRDIYFVLTDDGTSLGKSKILGSKAFISKIKDNPNSLKRLMDNF